MNIIPVYGIAGFVDVIILNSIEFWTGSKPMASTIKSDDGTVVTFNEEKQEMSISYGGNNFVVVPENGKAVVKDAEGKFIASVITNANGSMSLVDIDGKVLSTYSSQEVTSLLEVQ